MRQHPEVLVAGAGPVGLYVAHALKREGVPVEVFDTGIWACAHTYGLALHPRTVELLNEARIADEVLERGSPVHTVALYDGHDRRANVRVTTASGRPLLVIPQSVLESALEQALASTGVHVHWRHKVMRVEPDGDSVKVFVNRYEKESRGYVVARTDWVLEKSWTVEAPFVAGADGYDSAVRRSLNLKFDEAGPPTSYAVFEFRSDAEVVDEVRVVLTDKTTNVLWPLGGGWFRWSFELPDYTDPEVERLARYRERFGEPTDRIKDRLHGTSGDVNTLPDSTLMGLIQERAPWFKGSIHEVGWRTIVRFERRLASGFGKGRCWLAGDAAHLGAPVAVQSLNVGLAEARDLAIAIASAVRDGQRAAESFQQYENRYLAEWKRLHGLELTIEALPQVDPWVWDNRHRLLTCLPAHGADLTLLAEQLRLRI